MEQKFCAVALILTLLKIRLVSFHGGMDRKETLQGNSLKFTASIKLSMKLHPPVRASGNSFPCTPRTPILLITNSFSHTLYSAYDYLFLIFFCLILRNVTEKCINKEIHRTYTNNKYDTLSRAKLTRANFSTFNIVVHLFYMFSS